MKQQEMYTEILIEHDLTINFVARMALIIVTKKKWKLKGLVIAFV